MKVPGIAFKSLVGGCGLGEEKTKQNPRLSGRVAKPVAMKNNFLCSPIPCSLGLFYHPSVVSI